jgi:hypothetical protein
LAYPAPNYNPGGHFTGPLLLAIVGFQDLRRPAGEPSRPPRRGAVPRRGAI